MTTLIIRLVMLLVCAAVTNAWANSPSIIVNPGVSEGAAAFRQQTLFFQTDVMPTWRFDVDLGQLQPTSSETLTPLQPVLSMESIRISASRALPLDTPQWVYASLGASSFDTTQTTLWIYPLEDEAVAASIGWRLGESNRFIIEYEYRSQGETTVNALVMGVHYKF